MSDKTKQHFSLRCARCGKAQAMQSDALPEFGIDLMSAARIGGFVSVIDHRYSRTVIFCSDECADASVTKQGYLKRNCADKTAMKRFPSRHKTRLDIKTRTHA